MNDIGNAETNIVQLVSSLREIFICIRQSGLQLSTDKYEIATNTMKFFGDNISAKRISPEKTKITEVLDNFKMPKTTKQIKRLEGFAQFFHNYIFNLVETVSSFYKLLRRDAVIGTTEEHKKTLEVKKNELMEATIILFRLAKPGLHYVVFSFCDAS